MGTSGEAVAEARNQKRRQDYATDEAYRQACLASSRERYRKTIGREFKTCLDNVNRLGQFGTNRPVVFGTSEKLVLTFTISELGDVLGYSKYVIYRWKPKELIPDPIFEAPVHIKPEGKDISYDLVQGVYLAEEVRAMVMIIGEHQKHVLYYRERDTRTRLQLFAAVREARARYYGGKS